MLFDRYDFHVAQKYRCSAGHVDLYIYVSPDFISDVQVQGYADIVHEISQASQAQVPTLYSQDTRHV